MTIGHGKYWGVLTGDVIGFSHLDLSFRKQFPRIAVDAGRAFNEAFGPVLYGDAEVFRGDGWQALVERPAMSLRAALFFRAYLLDKAGEQKVDTRIAIGIGTVDYIPEGKISAGDGAAYRASGRLLGRMEGPRQGLLRCALSCDAFPPNPVRERINDAVLDAMVLMTGAMGDRWRMRQARAVSGALRGWGQQRIAENWGGPISRQAVGKHLQLAGWYAIDHAVRVFEEELGSVFAPSG
jgi:hypothetical protein